MKAHPFAEYLPMLDGAEWQSFLEDVKARGVLYAIVTHDGLILDGRNRWRAASELGIECPTTEFKGNDLLAFVMSSNLHRRHLSTKQRADIAASMANVEHGSNQFTQKVEGRSNDLPTKPITLAQAAAVMNVSEPSVKRAKAKKKGTPSQKPRGGWADAAVKHGLITVDGLRKSAKRGEVRAKIAEELGDQADLSKRGHTAVELEAINAAVARVADARQTPEERYVEHRREVGTLSESAKAKFERLVAAELAHVREAWQREVRSAAEEMIPELAASKARFDEEHRNYVIMRKGIAGVLNEEDYRFLLNALHPDREANRDKLNRCFLIAQGLDEYVKVAARNR